VLAAVLENPDDEVDDYLRALAEMAEASGGGITDPPQTVGDSPDWEDNRILDVAAAVGVPRRARLRKASGADEEDDLATGDLAGLVEKRDESASDGGRVGAVLGEGLG